MIKKKGLIHSQKMWTGEDRIEVKTEWSISRERRGNILPSVS